jgi:hypothetical protein
MSITVPVLLLVRPYPMLTVHLSGTLCCCIRTTMHVADVLVAGKPTC